MKFKLPLKREVIENLSLVELRELQDALYARALGLKQPTRKPERVIPELPMLEPDPFEDIAKSLAQVGDMLSALERDLQNPLSFADRINFEITHLLLIRCREGLRRESHERLGEPYPATN